MSLSARHRALGAAGMLVIAAGCSGGTSVVAPQSGAGLAGNPGFITPEAKSGPVIYVASSNDNAVEIYAQKGKNQKPIGSIAKGISLPSGLFVAQNGDLYVSNVGNYTITAYKSGQTSPYRTLTGVPTTGVIGIAVDSKGDVYGPVNESKTIEVWASGSTTPTSTLTDPSSDVYWAAVDSKNDLFVNDDALHVYEYPSTGGKPVLLKAIAFAAAGGLSIDAKDTLYVCDQGTGSNATISAYEKPYASKEFSFAVSDVLGCAVAENGKDIWAANYNADAGQEFALPKGTVVDAVTSGLSGPWGIAVSPPSKP